MKITLKVQGSEVPATLERVTKEISETKDWNCIELVCEKDNLWFSQLLLFVESEHGVVIRYCPQSGEDEYILKTRQKDKTSKQIETFDGGDTWLVEELYFCSIEEVEETVNFYLETGLRKETETWEIIGL